MDPWTARWAPCRAPWDRRRISAACRWAGTPRRRASAAAAASAAARPGRTSDSTAAAAASAAASRDALTYPRTWAAGAGARRPAAVWVPSEGPGSAGSFLRFLSVRQVESPSSPTTAERYLVPTRRSLHNSIPLLYQNPDRREVMGPRRATRARIRTDAKFVAYHAARRARAVGLTGLESFRRERVRQHATRLLLPRDAAHDAGKIPSEAT